MQIGGRINAMPPVVMTIAGSDPSGGAGIQADLKTFTALNCYGASAITALTAQNTTGVEGVQSIPPNFVTHQIRMVLSDISVEAFKTGMLYDAATIEAVVTALTSDHNANADLQIVRSTKTSAGNALPPIVVDPVCVSTSGHTLLEPSALLVMISQLFPLAALITPNKAEAELLLSEAASTGRSTKHSSEVRSSEDKHNITTLSSAITAAEKLGSLTGTDVLLKGGHLTVRPTDIRKARSVYADVTLHWPPSRGRNMEILQTGLCNDSESDSEELVVDVLYENKSRKCSIYARPRIDSSSTHGTGCTLSAAITCYLARGHSVAEAVRLGTAYTHTGIETAFPLGHGHGPLNHLHAVSPRLIPPPTNSDPYPFTRTLIESNATVWRQYVEHPFVKQLGSGVLSKDSFLHFVKQDYQYLKYYARAYGLVVAKSRRFSSIELASTTIKNVIHEVTMHKDYCADWDITEEELVDTPESAATTAYGAYLLDVGMHGDETKLIVALAACLLGYGEVGLWLKAEAKIQNSWVVLKGNPYEKWIEDYSGEAYQGAVKAGLDILEETARDDPPSEKRFNEWKEVWGRCTLLEKGFWDMALNLS